jgi:hypothetical protein
MIICKVQVSEDAARESHRILKYRTRIMQQEAADGSSGENCSADVERLQDDNEALRMKVIALTAQLDVCLIGTKQGIQKPFGLSAQNKEYTEMLKMELINAKTTIAELMVVYDEFERSKLEFENQKETWRKNRPRAPRHMRK